MKIVSNFCLKTFIPNNGVLKIPRLFVPTDDITDFQNIFAFSKFILYCHIKRNREFSPNQN